MRLRPGDQSAREESRDAPQRPRTAPAIGAPVRCLELQRTAGNRAVSRVLARLTEEDLTAIRKDRRRKKTYEEARDNWTGAFGPSGKYRAVPSFESWEHLVAAADSVEDLLAGVNAEVGKAAKYVPPKASKEEKEEKKPAPVPAAATTGEGTKENKKNQQRSQTMTHVPLGGAPPPAWNASSLPKTMTTASPNPTPAPTITAPLTPVFDLSAHTDRIDNWSPTAGHAGHSVTGLSLNRVQEIVTWLRTSYFRTDRVWIKRGPGSGGWNGALQLKIIHRSVTEPASGKKATYHLTLSQPVYDSLTNVEFAGADWNG